METVSSGAVMTVWWGSIALLGVVTVVVAILLVLILRTATAIDDAAAVIWTEGKLVANNTIQIPLLIGITVRTVRGIRGVAGQIAGATSAIQHHAESCPGCPHCVLGGGVLGGGPVVGPGGEG